MVANKLLAQQQVSLVSHSVWRGVGGGGGGGGGDGERMTHMGGEVRNETFR